MALHSDFAQASGSGLPTLARKKQQNPSEKALSLLASRGISSLQLSRNPDGSAEVEIEKGERIHLSPLLAELLTILSEPGDSSPNESFVGWKSLSALVARLEGTAGRSFSAHAVINLISRLSDKLVVPGWIQRDGRGNYRLALLRERA